MLVTEQVRTVAATILVGFAGGLLYDVYRVWRKATRPGPRLTAFYDLVFWLLLAGVVFGTLMPINQGEIRFYFLLALGCGALCYFRFCSPAVLRVLHRVQDRTRATWRRCTAFCPRLRALLRWPGNLRR